MDTFLKYKDYVYSLVGHSNSTNAIELYSVCKKIFGDMFENVIGSEMVGNVIADKYYIINNRESNTEGEHWLSLVKHRGKTYIYDSFDRSAKVLNNDWSKHPDIVMFSNRVYTQTEQERNCGIIAISSLMLYRTYGPSSWNII